jgi:hypothetical protein
VIPGTTPSSLAKDTTKESPKPTARLLALLAVLLAAAALGVGLVDLSSGQAPMTPQAGVVLGVNDLGQSPTFEGGIRPANGGSSFPAGIWTSGGITLHRGERVEYFNVKIAIGGGGSVIGTIITQPTSIPLSVSIRPRLGSPILHRSSGSM